MAYSSCSMLHYGTRGFHTAPSSALSQRIYDTVENYNLMLFPTTTKVGPKLPTADIAYATTSRRC